MPSEVPIIKLPPGMYTSSMPPTVFVVPAGVRRGTVLQVNSTSAAVNSMMNIKGLLKNNFICPFPGVYSLSGQQDQFRCPPMGSTLNDMEDLY